MSARVLVTGSEGYIGTILTSMLRERGYEVVGLDTGFFAEGNLCGDAFSPTPFLKKDVRDVEPADLDGFDAVVHLAALSNDPLGQLDEGLTYAINLEASVKLAESARSAGVRRFVFASSCSLYGAGGGATLTEESPARPQTAYGRSKILAEEAISRLARGGFSPVFMRNATAYGASPRMRFDLVVNSLTGYARTAGEIRILGDGKPWRPIVHVRDISGAAIAALEAETDAVHNQAFNVGDSRENYQIRTIAERIQKHYPECGVSVAVLDSGDARDYRVAFDKLNRRLGYHVAVSLDAGIAELKAAYETARLDHALFGHRLYTRLSQIRYLLDQGSVDRDLRLRA